MVKELTGNFKIEYHYDENNKEKKYEIDFEPPFDQIRYSQLIELLS